MIPKPEEKFQSPPVREERADRTWEEIGFAEFPIVTTSLKRPPFDTLEFIEPIGKDAAGNPMHRGWKMVSSREYGLPRLPDLDIFVAILKALERHNYEKKLIPCTAADVCADVGLKPGGETYQRVRAGFLRFQTTDYVAQNVFTDPKTKDRVLSEGWGIIADHRIVTDAAKPSVQDGLPPSFFAVSSTFLNRLRQGQRKPVDLGLWRQLPLGLEKPIYRYLDKNFYGPKDHHEIGLRKFGERIGLTGHYRPYDLKRLYKKPLSNLVAIGFLSRFSFEPSRSADDPEKLVAIPGQKARMQRKTVQRLSAYQETTKPPSDERMRPNSAVSVPDIAQLISYFSLKQFGVEKTHVSAGEQLAAQKLLALAGKDSARARAIIDFAIQEAKKTRFPMNNIGGVLANSYPERALAAPDVRRDTAAKVAEREIEYDLKQQYETWYRQEVRKRYDSLEPTKRDRLLAEASEELRTTKNGHMFDRWPDHRQRMVESKVRRRISQDLPSFDDWMRQRNIPTAA